MRGELTGSMRVVIAIALLLSSLPAPPAAQHRLAVLEFQLQQVRSIDRRTFSSPLQNAGF